MSSGAEEELDMVRLRDARGDQGAVIPGPFGGDTRHLVNQRGIPPVVFGPGSIAQAHKPDEHIEIDEYLACIEHLVEFIPAWCGIAGDV